MKENLIKEPYWNPFIALDKNGNGYRLENIKVYSEKGVIIETDRGWFGDNNDLGNCYIGEISLRGKVNLNGTENFVIKEEKKSYRLENNYTLYVYYKNINCKFLGYSVDGLFLRSNFEILDGYKFDDVLGFRNSNVDKIRYSELLSDAFKKLDTYNFDAHYDEMDKAIKFIQKQHKLLEEAKKEADGYTVKDYRKMIRTSSDGVDAFYLINVIDKTFGTDINSYE